MWQGLEGIAQMFVWGAVLTVVFFVFINYWWVFAMLALVVCGFGVYVHSPWNKYNNGKWFWGRRV